MNKRVLAAARQGLMEGHVTEELDFASWFYIKYFPPGDFSTPVLLHKLNSLSFVYVGNISGYAEQIAVEFCSISNILKCWAVWQKTMQLLLVLLEEKSRRWKHKEMCRGLSFSSLLIKGDISNKLRQDFKAVFNCFWWHYTVRYPNGKVLMSCSSMVAAAL